MEKIKINHKTIDLDIILKLSELKQQKFIEDCTNSCFNAGCCYETRGALTKQEDKPQYDFATVEDCTDSCFNAGCCYETRGALTKQEDKPQYDFTTVEDCTNSCFNAGCCYETRGALTKQEDKPQYDFATVEDCTDSCFNAGCCYETRGALTKQEDKPQYDFATVEDCTDSCFNAGCCYETRGALTKQEDKPQYDFATVEDCTNSCFNAGCCYETRGALTKQEDFNFTPKRKKLASVHLEITHSCNHKCFYCFNTSNKNIPINKTTIDEIFKISDSLIITGGEPFINPKQVVDIVKYATSLRFKNISINTNASLIEKETILELSKINPKISFLISIPTVNNQHYEEIVGTNDLEKVLNNIKLLLNTFGQQNIVGNMVIHKLNMYDISETAETLYKMGLRCLKHSFMAPYKESKKYIIDDKDIDYVFRSLAENKNKYNWYMFGSTHAFPLCRIPNILLNNKYPFVKCGAGNAIASISTDGLMYSCPSMNNNAIRITDFINNKANLISHKEIIQNIQKPCKDCGLLAYCGAGCMCENQIISGSLFSAPLYAKELTEEEILIRKVSLGIPCNINDVLDFEKVNELYSRIKFCNTWLNEDLILFSNELVEKIEKNEFSTINSKKIMQFLFKIHQISHAA